MTNRTAEIIPFPTRKTQSGGSQWAIGSLRTQQLFLATCALMNLAVTAHEVGDDENFYELIRSIHIAAEQLLAEAGQI